MPPVKHYGIATISRLKKITERLKVRGKRVIKKQHKTSKLVF